MANAQGLIRRLDKAFSKVQITDRVVYKRLLSRGGGDPLIGRIGTVTFTDTQLDPQPVISVPTNDTNLIMSGTRIIPASDYIMMVSPSALSREDLENKDVVLVLKDTHGNEEDLAIVAYSPTVYVGTVIVFNVLARSKRR